MSEYVREFGQTGHFTLRFLTLSSIRSLVYWFHVVKKINLHIFLLKILTAKNNVAEKAISTPKKTIKHWMSSISRSMTSC